jgi:transcriptional regulator with XRE-family HTH domain
METLGDRLRAARTRARGGVGITQEDLAHQAEVSKASVQNWETGKTEPRRSKVAAIAAALGVSPGWLLNGEADFSLALHVNDEPEPGVSLLLADAAQCAALTLTEEERAKLSGLRANGDIQSIEDAKEWLSFWRHWILLRRV